MNRPELESLADRLLLTIRRKPNREWSVQRLCERLETDMTALAQAVSILTEWGYRLKRSSNSLAFIGAPDRLTKTEISFGLKTKTIGANILAYRTVKSTNDLAHELAESGAAEGTLIVAEEQTKGRGRFQRAWHSPSGTGIYMSLILRPKFSPEKAPGLSIVTAYALAETINRYLPDRAMIKWPNDILIGRKKSPRVRKAAGILTELSAEKNKIHYVVIGVGINVNQGIAGFPEELRFTATSIRRALRRKVNRVELLQSFLVNLEQAYLTYSKRGLSPIRAKIRKYSYLIGRDIKVSAGPSLIIGRATDIDSNGCLIIKTETGLITITAGEVTICKD